MDIDKELYQFSCIKNMGDVYFKKWENIKNVYAPLLDQGSILRQIAFTYHDYSHHCYNIYKIISQIILHDPQLTEQEWFILNTAALLHDFSMTEANFDRMIHSKQSAMWLLESRNKEVHLKENLSEDETEAIALVIEAHSDCKKSIDGKEEISEYTLEKPELKKAMDCGGAKPVQVKFLSAILRIADECDVTRKRLGTADFSKLDENDPEQRYSKEQWLQLKCFKNLDRNREDLILYIDDNYVKSSTGEIRKIERRIWNVVSKIRKELDYIRQQAITTNDYLAMFQIRNVKIESSIMDKNYVERVNKNSFSDKKMPELKIHILDNDLANRIEKKIEDDKLITTGHYIVTDTCCERDWIDLRDIVVDKYLSSQMINRIINEIDTKYKNCEEPPIIVGMEDNGLILASQIAYRLGFPFSYIVPCNHNQKRSSKQERKVDLNSYNKIILITDAVATFQTLGNTCIEYNILNKICKIYAVLYRKPKDETFFHKDGGKLMEKLTACCDSFQMEVFNRKECPENNTNRCTAVNK